jgi:beta-glucanase (GH16 family)
VKEMSSQFHTYAIEWTPAYIKAFVDEIQYFSYEDTADSMTWPFDQPQNIILNLAMGGGWGGARGMDQTITSQQIVIDYVRVYEKR